MFICNRGSGAFKNAIVTIMGVMVLVLIASQTSVLAKTANGKICKISRDCQSGYCSSKLKHPGPFGIAFCMDRRQNCVVPGGSGIRFYGEYNYGGQHWYCAPRVGLLHDGKARCPNFNPGGPRRTFTEQISHGQWRRVFTDVANEFTARCGLYCAVADTQSAGLCSSACTVAKTAKRIEDLMSSGC